MKPGISIEGLDGLDKEINRLLKETKYKTPEILLKAAKKVQKRIREKAPGSIKKATYAKAYPEKVNSDAVAFAGIRPKQAPQAGLVEKGHAGPLPGSRRTPPHPFVRPAWDELHDEIRDDIARDLGKAIEGK